MRVLDLGCGPGDVSFLAAEMVGASGWVIGIDQAPEAITLARNRAREKGIKNVDFELTPIEMFSSPIRFDAVVGRYILVQIRPHSFSAALDQHSASRSVLPDRPHLGQSWGVPIVNSIP